MHANIWIGHLVWRLSVLLYTGLYDIGGSRRSGGWEVLLGVVASSFCSHLGKNCLGSAIDMC